jgi:transposase
LSTLFVGIDVSKDLSTAQGIDSRGNSQFSIEFTMNAEGFSKLLKAIRKHCQSLTKATIAMESTGCYHMNLFSFLTYKGVQCVVINPLLIANFSRLSLRKLKTDKKDAGTIAQFLRVHKDSLTQMMLSENIQDLRDLARERESLVSMLCGLKNDIRRILQITFPELESICNIFSETILTLLTQFPSARMIRAAQPEAIADGC